MNTLPLLLAGSLTRGWVRAYTAGLPTRIRADRKAEIASDLWEQATEGGIEGESANAVAAHIFGRTVLGMPADVAWHLGELKGDDMQLSIGQKSIVGLFILLGVATVVFGVIGIVIGIVDGWLFTDALDTIYGLVLIVIMATPFVATAGVYAWRRADAEGRSTKRARVMIVVGTLGMAALAFWMWWTIIGPVIAVSIVAYWVHKIRDWRGGDTPRTA